MVWNRRATKSGGGKVNPVSAWVWSAEPTQPALVSRGTFLAAQGIAERRERSPSAPGLNTAHPQAQRTYRLRSYIYCGDCGRRMSGKAPRKVAYYVCRPAGKTPEGHPPGIWVPERSLVTGVHAFFAERIFGPDRAALLAEQLDGSDVSAAVAQREQAASLRDWLAETSTRRSGCSAAWSWPTTWTVS
jgi:hypothetical protein